MSATTPPPTTATDAIALANGRSSLVRNLEVAAQNGAKDVPLVARSVATLDPELNAYLEGKSLLGSKTIIAPIVAHVVAWAVVYFGLGWDAATTESVAGLISIGLMATARYVARVPITSIFPKRGG